MSKSVLLVGGTGVVGRRALASLVAAGHQVTANVRTPAMARWVTTQGARPTTIDIFDIDEVRRAAGDADAVINLATSIPTGMRAARLRSWRANDRLRREGAANLAGAVERGGAYIGESIAMSYADAGSQWIDEHGERPYGEFDAAVSQAERAADSARTRGVTAVTLRFAMFWAADSAHTRDIVRLGRRGLWSVPGLMDDYISFVHADDAGRAVVAALDAPSGVYNVAEPDPCTRGAHAGALAVAVGRRRLRSLSTAIRRLGGTPLQFLGRSQRISSAKLAEATRWEPRMSIVDHWGEALG